MNMIFWGLCKAAVVWCPPYYTVACTDTFVAEKKTGQLTGPVHFFYRHPSCPFPLTEDSKQNPVQRVNFFFVNFFFFFAFFFLRITFLRFNVSSYSLHTVTCKHVCAVRAGWQALQGAQLHLRLLFRIFPIFFQFPIFWKKDNRKPHFHSSSYWKLRGNAGSAVLNIVWVVLFSVGFTVRINFLADPIQTLHVFL